MLDRVYALKDRLAETIIENKDWHDCLKVYDAPKTFFFLDPPYIGGDIRSYAAWSLPDLASLRESLRAIKGSWLLTINDSKETRAVFRGCRLQRFERQRGISNRAVQVRYHELIVRPPKPALGD